MPPDDIYAAKEKDGSELSVLFITADGTEDFEFFYPYYRFIEEGLSVDVATPRGTFKGKLGAGLKKTKTLADVSPDDYSFLYIPGGKAPEALKKEPQALELVRRFVSGGKIIAAICHGPQLLAKAGVIDGREISGWPEIQREIEEAGATFRDEQTLVDGQFVTARWPADLPYHVGRTLELVRGGTVAAGAGRGESRDMRGAVH